MTKARFRDLPHRSTGKDKMPAIGDAAVRKYNYMPGLTHSALESRGLLHGGGALVELPSAQSLLREFLALLQAAQEELDQRWNDQEKSGSRPDRV